MRKVMVVDDESFIRLGIKAIIERHPNSNYEVILASNGIEALNIMEKENIDILITDIRMPKMDGIALIQALKVKKSKPEIVILSGFDEFSYASEAIKCGAREYLLKPVKRNDIFDCLDKLETYIKENENNTNKVEMARNYIEQYRITELNYIFLKENIGKEELNNIIHRIDLDVFKGEFYFGLIKRKGMEGGFNSKGFIKEITDILEGYKKNVELEILIYLDAERNIVLISKERELFGFLKQYIETNNLIKFYVGVKDSAVKVENLKNAYSEAKRALNYRFLFKNKHYINSTEIESTNTGYTIPRASIGKLYNMLGSDREKDIENIIIEIMNINIIKLYDISYFENIIREVNTIVLNNIKNKYFSGEDIIFNNSDKLASLNNYDDFSEYYHDLKSYLLNINEYISNIGDIYGEKKLMDKAVEYIHKNYTNGELSLSMVSNEISMNYSYFSQMFKEHTGENFVNYIQRLRIDKAKQFLQNPDYKVYEIGDKVGYKDSKQFAKVFKKVTGISPREYRSQTIEKCH